MGDFVYISVKGPECSCKKCWDVLENPVTLLNCGHSFCRKCAVGMVKSRGHCHYCGKPVTMADIGECSSDVRKALDSLTVGCQKPRCTWTGPLGKLNGHVCPRRVSSLSRTAVYQDLLARDERLHVKVSVLDCIRKRIIASKNVAKCASLLGLVCETLHNYPNYLEIVDVCLDILVYVANDATGILRIMHEYEIVQKDLMYIKSIEPMRERAEAILGKMNIGRVEYGAVDAMTDIWRELRSRNN